MSFYEEINEYQKRLSGKDYDELDLKTEFALAEKAAEGCEESISILVKSRMKYAIKRAVQLFSRYRIDSHDLISCANIALTEAVKRFDPSKGTKLTTYYEYWLHNECFKFMNRNHVVKIPKSITSNKEKLKELNIQAISIDQQQNGHDGDGEYNILDVMGVSTEPSTEVDTESAIIKSFGSLSDMEAFVIISRFFFDKTLREVAEEIGDITHQGISVIEARALKKMRGAIS